MAGPNDRPPAFECTVAEQREKNIHIHDGISEAEFVAMRTKRDATLEMPVLILPAVQVNVRADAMRPNTPRLTKRKPANGSTPSIES